MNFQKLEYRFLENLTLFHMVFKRNLYKEGLSNVKTKTMPRFAVNVFKETTINFYHDLICYFDLYSMGLRMFN